MKNVKLAFAVFVGLIGCVCVVTGINWMIQSADGIRLALVPLPPGGRRDYEPWFVLTFILAPLAFGLLLIAVAVRSIMQISKDR
jgi:hypothetical protein